MGYVVSIPKIRGELKVLQRRFQRFKISLTLNLQYVTIKFRDSEKMTSCRKNYDFGHSRDYVLCVLEGTYWYGRGVKSNYSGGKGVIEWVKFAVHKYCGKVETVGVVDLFDILDSSGQS